MESLTSPLKSTRTPGGLSSCTALGTAPRPERCGRLRKGLPGPYSGGRQARVKGRQGKILCIAFWGSS